MCGIAGAFRVDGTPGLALPEDVLRRMTEVIAHRGPNDAGLVIEDGVALGARRLSIVDVDGGHQPMANETGTVWGAQNGEIYNHVELRRQLTADGHHLRTRCDTEVLPHLWEAEGPGLCEQLRGKFAVAVWDTARGEGVIARDRLGIKPLYYAEKEGLLIFGSELKSVVASGLVSAELDLEALASYLTLGFVPAPLTPLREVKKLPAGERLIVRGGGVFREPYWTYPTPPAEPVPMSEDEAAERVLDVLEESVVSRLMSDVPLGAMLSGGLDSSLIVALMARHMDEPVKTFAVGFAGAGSGNELGDARVVAEALGTEHHELELPLGATHEELAELAWHLDEPVADLSSLGFFALCQLSAQHVTVALSGQGADELLGGYRRHALAALSTRWHRVPSPMRAVAARAIRAGRPGSASALRSLEAPDPVARMLSSIGLLHPELRGELYSGALGEFADAAERHTRSHFTSMGEASPLEAAMYLEAQMGLQDDRLHYFDRASMACSLEVRVPFLDHKVVEAYAALPQSAKVRGNEGKVALRRAAVGLVPESVLRKPKLGFFSSSVGAWLERSDVIEEVLLNPFARYGEVVDRELVERVVAEWRAGDRRHARAILALIMLELWLSEFVPRAFAAAQGRQAA